MLQEMARGLKFRMWEVQELHCLCSENEGADQFRGTAKLICAHVLAYAKSRFSHAAQLSIDLLANLLHCGSFNAHK